MLCRSLFVLLSFFLWPMCCLSFELLILITHLVSSNSSYLVLSLITRYKAKLSEPMHLLFDNRIKDRVTRTKLKIAGELRKGSQFLLH
jgi:hypothetical protein